MYAGWCCVAQQLGCTHEVGVSRHDTVSAANRWSGGRMLFRMVGIQWLRSSMACVVCSHLAGAGKLAAHLAHWSVTPSAATPHAVCAQMLA
jgi:hypothetical protein